MSQDFDVLCDRCKTYHHFGQYMAATGSFGYGSSDEQGRTSAMSFIVKHLYCDPDSDDGRHGFRADGTPKSTCGAGSLRIVLSDLTPGDYREEEEPA